MTKKCGEKICCLVVFFVHSVLRITDLFPHGMVFFLFFFFFCNDMRMEFTFVES